MTHHDEAPNRWKGFVLGAVGGAVGAIAMGYYWKAVEALTGQDPRQQEGGAPQTEALDSISLVGTHHQPGESSTAAVGRIAYQQVTGKAPAEETKKVLSYLVHWLISILAGGAYGALRGRAPAPDLAGGLALGVSLWLFGDELAIPLLGLSNGPTAYAPTLHLHSLGAHLLYGIATTATAQLLYTLSE